MIVFVSLVNYKSPKSVEIFQPIGDPVRLPDKSYHQPGRYVREDRGTEARAYFMILQNCDSVEGGIRLAAAYFGVQARTVGSHKDLCIITAREATAEDVISAWRSDSGKLL